MEHLWILYDERAHTEGTDDACVFVTCNSMIEVMGYVDDFQNPAVFRYDIVKRDGKDLLVNEHYITIGDR